MKKADYAKLFTQSEDTDFSGEEITTFKRYIEENNVYTENSFEFFEGNLNYYSVRHTSSHFFSPSRLFHVNSNYIESLEMSENLSDYNSSIKWTKKTIHPEDSQHVIKQEKYVFLDELNDEIGLLISFLNTFPVADYHCVDILIYSEEKLYKYLPEKNFVFTWRKNCSQILTDLSKCNFGQSEQALKDKTIESLIVPIFTPIRECLFLGDFGYRDAIITYGQIIERLIQYLNKGMNTILLRRFDNFEVQKIFNVDGVDRSIMDMILCHISLP